MSEFLGSICEIYHDYSLLMDSLETQRQRVIPEVCQMRLGERFVIHQEGCAPPIAFGTVSKICVESFQ